MIKIIIFRLLALVFSPILLIMEIIEAFTTFIIFIWDVVIVWVYDEEIENLNND